MRQPLRHHPVTEEVLTVSPSTNHPTFEVEPQMLEQSYRPFRIEALSLQPVESSSIENALHKTLGEAVELLWPVPALIGADEPQVGNSLDRLCNPAHCDGKIVDHARPAGEGLFETTNGEHLQILIPDKGADATQIFLARVRDHVSQIDKGRLPDHGPPEIPRSL